MNYANPWCIPAHLPLSFSIRVSILCTGPRLGKVTLLFDHLQSRLFLIHNYTTVPEKGISKKAFPPCILEISVHQRSVDWMSTRQIAISRIYGSSRLTKSLPAVLDPTCSTDKLLWRRVVPAMGVRFVLRTLRTCKCVIAGEAMDI
jgi:hypothetical protein